MIEYTLNLLSHPAWAGGGVLLGLIVTSWPRSRKLLLNQVRWLGSKCHRDSSSQRSFSIALDDKFQCEMPPGELRNLLFDALHFVRNGQTIEITVEYSAAFKIRANYRRLCRKRKLNEEQLQERNKLQSYLAYLETRLSRISASLNFAVSGPIRDYIDTDIGDDEWEVLVRGLIDRVNQIGNFVYGTKFDVWHPAFYALSAGMWINEPEVEAVTKQLNVTSAQAIMGPGWLLGELPRDVLIRQGIPTVISIILFTIKLDRLTSDELKNVCCYRLWNFGLG